VSSDKSTQVLLQKCLMNCDNPHEQRILLATVTHSSRRVADMILTKRTLWSVHNCPKSFIVSESSLATIKNRL